MIGRKLTILAAALTVGLAWSAGSTAWSQTVRITPLGSHDGEFCRSDRAFLLEDPNGTTLLFDVGRTVAGPEDPRLGKVDVVLLSSVHGQEEALRQYNRFTEMWARDFTAHAFVVSR